MSLAIKSAVIAGRGGIGRGRAVQGGGIFSAIGSVVKKVANVGAQLLPGPVGAVARTAISTLGGQARPSMGAPAVIPGLGLVPPPGGGGVPTGARVPGVGAAVARILPGGQTGLGTGCASGFHPNKTSYFLKDGTYIEKGTVCVRNRRRNPLNPRALDRSMARIASTGNALRGLGFRAPSSKAIAQKGKPKKRRK